MNKKLVEYFLIITFILMLLGWGSCAILSQLFDFTVNHPVLRILFLIGGFSPTAASYISLKKVQAVTGFKQWVRRVFDIKHSICIYFAVLIFVAIYYILGCAISGFTLGAPVFMQLLIVPMMLFGGGNEEVGWRMILQPELEKRFGFHKATWITAVIWWLWHLPLFFIKGTVNADMNYFLFGIMCLTLSYALAAVRKISEGTFPCILTHCMINGLSATFVFLLSPVSCIVTLFITVAAALLILRIQEKE